MLHLQNAYYIEIINKCYYDGNHVTRACIRDVNFTPSLEECQA